LSSQASSSAQSFSDASLALVYISREFPSVFSELAMVPGEVRTERGMRENLRRVAPLLERINKQNEGANGASSENTRRSPKS
ncbi:hypothetical protein TrRE_jg2418, partial [Triparma retinervis]